MIVRYKEKYSSTVQVIAVVGEASVTSLQQKHNDWCWINLNTKSGDKISFSVPGVVLTVDEKTAGSFNQQAA